MFNYFVNLISPDSEKKNPLPNEFLIFRKMEISGSNTKKLLTFPLKKAFSYVLENGRPPYISGTNFPS